MKKAAILMMLIGLLTQPAFAQWPAGTPAKDAGPQSSPMGNPAPQEEMKTHRNEKGELVTEDGRQVKGMPHDENVSPNANMQRTEEEPSSDDPVHQRATPGEAE